MVKTVLKEIGIAVLLLIAITLIFLVLFYDYIPDKKTLPEEVKPYAYPEDVKEELGSTLKEGQEIVRTFYIDNTDLDVYEAAKEYNKGKANPFAETQNANAASGSSGSSSTGTKATTNNANSSSSAASNNSSSSSSQTNDNSSSSANTGSEYVNNKAGKYN